MATATREMADQTVTVLPLVSRHKFLLTRPPPGNVLPHHTYSWGEGGASLLM